MLGQGGILKEFSTRYWLLSLDWTEAVTCQHISRTGTISVLLGWFSIQTSLDSFLCVPFLTVGCSSWMIWKINCRLPSQLAMSGRLSILNIQVFRYLSLDRWISGCVLPSTFWWSSLVVYNHNQEYLVSLALPATSFLLTENSTTFLGYQNCLQQSPCPGMTWTSVSSCLVALKHRCCSITSTSSILQSFVTWLLQPPLFLRPTLLTFIYSTASSLLSQLRILALSSFHLHVPFFFVHPLSILCLPITPDKQLFFFFFC